MCNGSFWLERLLRSQDVNKPLGLPLGKSVRYHFTLLPSFMSNRLLFFIGFVAVFLLLDFYFFQALKTLTENSSTTARRVLAWVYWGYTAFSIICLIVAFTAIPPEHSAWRNVLSSIFAINVIAKVFALPVLLLDDGIRLVRWAAAKLGSTETTGEVAKEGISRSDFLVKTAVAAAAFPVVTMSFGILSGAYDYRIRRRTVYLPNLPASFDGIKLVQLSDIHSGSFYKKKAVLGGVEMAMKEKPDLIFFTGDIVNNVATELIDYQDIFSKLKAPLGVYSTLGNHDYGDYVQWESVAAKRQNLQNLMAAERQMGWNLMMNENKILRQGSDQIAVVGIENWGAKGRFPKYGKLAEALQGTEEASVKLLLSHDPSHWDAQVRPQFSDIDIMFAGHTHGMQFGIDTKYYKWSPVQYMYDQWADLYQKEHQYLYVNRGFGFLGYPGRVGILPEITVMELKKA